MITDEIVRLNAPEATNYQADSNATRVDEQVFTWNP
jgi:hypothetical protein